MRSPRRLRPSQFALTAGASLLVLSGLAAVPAQADPAPAGSAVQQTITLAVEQQPKIPRPTLERLKRESAAKGISLKQALDTRIAEKAATDPAATANWPDGPVDIPDVMIDDLSASQINDLAGMADSLQIPLEESIERYGYQRYGDRVAGQLKAAFPDQLSGFTNENGGGAWIGFKNAIPGLAVQLAKTLPGRVELHGNLGYSEVDLPKAQEQIDRALRRTPGVKAVSTWYDPKLGIGGVVVPSADAVPALTDSTLRSSLATLTAANPAITVAVSIRAVNRLGRPFDQYIRGGGNLGPEDCTSGFNLISESGTSRRLGSAGHCVTTDVWERYCNQSADGGCTYVIGRWRYVGNGGDVGFYEHGTEFTATRTFYWDWGQKKYADARSAGPKVGDAVCKFGFTTGRSCGTVTALNQNDGAGTGGLVRTTIPSGPATCYHGDSGGPFHRDGGEAYGVLTGDLVDGNGARWCAFTPVNRFYNGARYYVWTR
ncbi:S1 family peptidase [Nonomuraea typhae]|uniref:S1 family peptidase n=1 Tax=Nonomuraea typhae TaxID=2603600 RepID=A0ABW7Z718_9ACTN